MSILVTNDDGRNSPGFETLYRAARRADRKCAAIVPVLPKSGVGKSFTFHKPLRLTKALPAGGAPVYELSGTPADCVIFGVSRLLKKDGLKLVVAGINSGDNTTVQAILSSGTVGASFEAAIYGIPAIAFSQDSPPERWGDASLSGKVGASHVEEFCFRLISRVIKDGLPVGAHALSVNFPRVVTAKTPVAFCKPDFFRFVNFFERRTDPFGRDYYWNNIKRVTPPNPDGDFRTVTRKGLIAITPMSLAFSSDELVRRAKKLYRL